MGEKRKEGKNQRTVLHGEEVQKIIDTFVEQKVEDDFSVVVTNDEIAQKKYSFSAGQYFEVKIEYIEMSEKEFNDKLNSYVADLENLWGESRQLAFKISRDVGSLKYED